MKGTILEKILEAKRESVADAKRQTDLALLKDRAFRAEKQSHRLRNALSVQGQINIIAEFKRASPSKGIINDAVDPAKTSRAYKNGGAAAISVLTEEDFFKGSLKDLRVVREWVDLPILRKDFIFDAYQIYEAAAAGADAILLIAAMLEDEVLQELYHLAETEIGIDALVEVHSLEELERVKILKAKLIGVNNRNLKSFDVSLNVSRELINHAPEGSIFVTESGLKTKDDLIELNGLGYSGFLIGETLMRSSNAEDELRKMLAGDGMDTVKVSL